MLFLLFEIGSERYALETERIVEVIPLVSCEPSPHAPAGIAGTFSFHGGLVPALDLFGRALERPAPHRRNTRIVVIAVPSPGGDPRLIGLIAEKVTDTIRCDAADFAAATIPNPGTPDPGAALRDSRGVIRRFEIDRLLPEAVRRVLLSDVAAA